MTLGLKSQTAIYACIIRKLNLRDAKVEEVNSELFAGWQKLQSNGTIRECQLGIKPFDPKIIS